MAAEVKPAKVPRWNDGLANQTEPTEGKKDLGWVLDEEPPSSFFNFLQHFTGLWFKWFNQRFFDGGTAFDLEIQGVDADPGVDQDGGDLTLSGGDATGNVGSQLLLKIAIAGQGSGSTPRVATEVARLDDDGVLRTTRGLNASGVGLTSSAAIEADGQSLRPAIIAEGGNASFAAIEITGDNEADAILATGGTGAVGKSAVNAVGGAPNGPAIRGTGTGNGAGAVLEGGNEALDVKPRSGSGGKAILASNNGSSNDIIDVNGTGSGQSIDTRADGTGDALRATATGGGAAVRALATSSQTAGIFDSTAGTGYAVSAAGDNTNPPIRTALRIVPQLAEPDIALIGDIMVDLSGRLKICTTAGDSAPTPPVFTVVGTQV